MNTRKLIASIAPAAVAAALSLGALPSHASSAPNHLVAPAEALKPGPILVQVKPDLVAKKLSWDGLNGTSAAYTTGVKGWFYTSVFNGGKAAAGACKVKVHVQGPTAATTTDIVSDLTSLPAGSGAGSSGLPFVLGTSGHYKVTAYVDSTNLVAESSELNNVVTLEFDVFDPIR